MGIIGWILFLASLTCLFAVETALSAGVVSAALLCLAYLCWYIDSEC